MSETGFSGWLRSTLGLGPAKPRPTLNDLAQDKLFQGLPIDLNGKPGDLAAFWTAMKLPEMRRMLQELGNGLPGKVELSFDMIDTGVHPPSMTYTGLTRDGAVAFRQHIDFDVQGRGIAVRILEPGRDLPDGMAARLPRLAAEAAVDFARAAKLDYIQFPHGKLLLDSLDGDVSYLEVWMKHFGQRLPYKGRAEPPAIAGGRTSMAPDTPFYTIHYPVTKPRAPWQTAGETHSLRRDAKPGRPGGDTGPR